MRAKAQPEIFLRADVDHILYYIVYFTNVKDITVNMEVPLFAIKKCLKRIVELTTIGYFSKFFVCFICVFFFNLLLS